MVQNRIATVFEIHIYELFKEAVKQMLGTSHLKLTEFQKTGNFEVRY